MATKKSDWVQRGRGVATRLREKWGAAVARAGQRVEAAEAARELITRDRAEARAEAVKVVARGSSTWKRRGKRAAGDRPTESS